MTADDLALALRTMSAAEVEEVVEKTLAKNPESEAHTAAGAGSAATRMARRQKTLAPARRDAASAHAAITASGLLGSIDGQLDRASLAESMALALGRMDKAGPARGVALCASARFAYPENRRLGRDAVSNGEIMDRECGVQAIVASGGVCMPGNVNYEVPTWATADRPLREGLASFMADRGAVRFVQPPDIGALAGATTIWTEATDASPGAATKPVIAVSCGQEELVYVDAVPTRLGFGNMMGRFAPEQVAANTDLAMAAAARIAENNLLNKIQAVAVKNMTSAKVLGATRDLITAINQAGAAFRWNHRVPRGVKMTAVLPDFVKDIVRVDLARELAHDNSGDFNVLAITDADVDKFLQAQGVNPIWHLDGQAAKTGGEAYPLQGFAEQGSGTLQAFPTKIVWYLFPEGAIQFLDGGRLDLGIVRDATLDSTNDYETFVETFEGIANRGFPKSVLQLVTELCANGQSGATATVSTCA